MGETRLLNIEGVSVKVDVLDTDGKSVRVSVLENKAHLIKGDEIFVKENELEPTET